MNVCKRIVVLLPTWRIGGNKRPDRLAEMGPDRLTEMGSDRLTEMWPERLTEMGPDRLTEKWPDWLAEMIVSSVKDKNRINAEIH